MLHDVVAERAASDPYAEVEVGGRDVLLTLETARRGPPDVRVTATGVNVRWNGKGAGSIQIPLPVRVQESPMAISWHHGILSVRLHRA